MHQEEMKEEGWAHKAAAGIKITYADVCLRMQTHADACRRMHQEEMKEEGWAHKAAAGIKITYADVC
jgi:hypothetical protein